MVIGIDDLYCAGDCGPGAMDTDAADSADVGATDVRAVDSAADADAPTCCSADSGVDARPMDADAQPMDADADSVAVIMDAPADSPLVSALRIRCGALPPAPLYTDSLGQVWSDDKDFDTGEITSNFDMIAGTSDPTLYHTERYADRNLYPNGFTYTFGGLPNGEYAVQLLFSETSSAPIRAAGEREFNVLVNGTQVLTNFDIYAMVGLDHALVETFFATVQNSPITVQFAPGAIQNPKVNAIQIFASSSAGD
jgi:malectin (di-glucose binding ER protein)